MDSKKHASLLLRNVPVGVPLTVEIDVAEFLRVISGIQAGGAILAKYATDPRDSQEAYDACCAAMREYFERMLVAKFPPSYKA